MGKAAGFKRRTQGLTCLGQLSTLNKFSDLVSPETDRTGGGLGWCSIKLWLFRVHTRDSCQLPVPLLAFYYMVSNSDDTWDRWLLSWERTLSSLEHFLVFIFPILLSSFLIELTCLCIFFIGHVLLLLFGWTKPDFFLLLPFSASSSPSSSSFSYLPPLLLSLFSLSSSSSSGFLMPPETHHFHLEATRNIP